MFKTEKLYYKDAYIHEFDATVVSLEEKDGKYLALLDKSAFFPEAGGQYSDKGYIGDAEVVDVQENGDVLVHYLKKPLNVNETYHCKLDFEDRLEKMRAHTAEHILSGIFHKLYGVENTGFHLGASEVTFDTSLVITKDQLELVERLANEAVIRNLAITEYYPTPEELPSLTYRSKLDLTENVRIVYIEDTDACACCAPHVRSTGEIGFIKILDAVKHKGGSRIRMLAGKKAYEYVSSLARETGAVSVLLSSPQTEISKDVERLLEAKYETEERLLARERELAALYSESVPETEGNFVLLCGTLDMEALRNIANSAGDRVGGALVLLSGSEGAYRYVIKYSKDDFKAFLNGANSALLGKGGGRPPMAQGSFSAQLSDIKKHFAE